MKDERPNDPGRLPSCRVLENFRPRVEASRVVWFDFAQNPAHPFARSTSPCLVRGESDLLRTRPRPGHALRHARARPKMRSTDFCLPRHRIRAPAPRGLLQNRLAACDASGRREHGDSRSPSSLRRAPTGVVRALSSQSPSDGTGPLTPLSPSPSREPRFTELTVGQRPRSLPPHAP